MNMFALVFSLSLAIGLGFGLSCHIYASILKKSNDIGNSVGEVSHYDAEVKFDRTMHRMDCLQTDEFNNKYINGDYFREEEEKDKTKPSSNTMII